MNKRQQRHYDEIKKYLACFGAKFKDGEEYIHSEKNIVIVNKYNIERVVLARVCVNLKDDNDYWTFDGKMCDRQKKELVIIKKIAESKGGKLLSDVYIDSESKLKFIDKEGFVFYKTALEIKKNKWSPVETKRVYCPKYHLNEIRKIAESRGGKLISTEYVNSKAKLELMDKSGNIFFMSSVDLKGNHWSGYESGNVYDNAEYHLNQLREIAKSKGGKLISTEYIKAHAKLEFEDKSGKRFFMTATDVKSLKRWSPYESGNVYNNPEYHLNQLREIAKSKGGKLISTEYVSSQIKLEFEDRLKNRFFSSPNQIKRGSWSPFEIVNISEEKCRQCIEFIFNKKFPNEWGVIKKNKAKKSLQLDGYNEEAKIAFEYQGEQHYDWQDVRSRTEFSKKKKFERIEKNDREKVILCKEKNIELIVIKYFKKCKKESDYLIHVLNEIKKIT